MGNELDPLVRDRLAEGIQQLKDGEGVDRPEWTRFKDLPAEQIGGTALAQTIEQ